MKFTQKIGLATIFLVLFSFSYSYAAVDTNLQPATIFDNTYTVFIWTKNSTFLHPRYVDQFEFKAGDVFSAYTTKKAELTGKWIETDLGLFTRFQAWVEKEEEPTTTTTIPEETTQTLLGNQITTQNAKYDINLWGISYVFTPPPPLNLFGYSIIAGSGAYLGVDSVFLGFASVPGVGAEPEFGSISPEKEEQGQTVEVTITGKYTKFEQAAIIVVDMGKDIDVGTPAVISDTELRVSITISETAEVGPRTVTVTYDSTVIFKADAFEVLKKTT